jgi:hypothetical protein
MTKIVMEVIAALSISVLPGLESASLNVKAEQAGKDASPANLAVAAASDEDRSSSFHMDFVLKNAFDLDTKPFPDFPSG